MMLNDVMQEAINEQINNELFAMYSYLSMSAYCEHKQFRGCAHWMRMQSEEEKVHAMRLYDFLIARQGRVKLRPIAEPQFDFASLPDVFQKAYQQEQTVTTQINCAVRTGVQGKGVCGTRGARVVHQRAGRRRKDGPRHRLQVPARERRPGRAVGPRSRAGRSAKPEPAAPAAQE